MQTVKKLYRLYALPLSPENIALASKERFSRATPFPIPGYVLIYSTSLVNNAVEITEEEVSRLSSGDSRWLFDCNVAIIAEEAKKHEAEVVKDLSFQLVALENELKKRKEELEKGGSSLSGSQGNGRTE